MQAQATAKKVGFDDAAGCVKLATRKPVPCRLSSKTGAKTQACIFAVLQTAHALLKSGRTATQREVYYLHKALFGSAAEASAAILKVCALLGVPRHRLGIVATSRFVPIACFQRSAHTCCSDPRICGTQRVFRRLFTAEGAPIADADSCSGPWIRSNSSVLTGSWRVDRLLKASWRIDQRCSRGYCSSHAQHGTVHSGC